MGKRKQSQLRDQSLRSVLERGSMIRLTRYTIFELSRMQSTFEYHSSSSLNSCEKAHHKQLYQSKSPSIIDPSSSTPTTSSSRITPPSHSLCAANNTASSLGKPIITAPSAKASNINATKAGPLPANAVHTSKCFSSMKRTRPHDEKRERRMEWVSVGVFVMGSLGMVVMMVMPC